MWGCQGNAAENKSLVWTLLELVLNCPSLTGSALPFRIGSHALTHQQPDVPVP